MRVIRQDIYKSLGSVLEASNSQRHRTATVSVMAGKTYQHLSLCKESILESRNSLTLVHGAALRVWVVTVDAATLGGPLGKVVLVSALGPAGNPPGSFAAAVGTWVHAVDATSLLVAEDSVAFGLDGLSLVIGVAGGVRVVAVDTAALAEPAELEGIVRMLYWQGRLKGILKEISYIFWIASLEARRDRLGGLGHGQGCQAEKGG